MTSEPAPTNHEPDADGERHPDELSATGPAVEAGAALSLRSLPIAARVFLVVFALAEGAALIVSGLDAFVAAAAVGTALGTLGLALFTWSLALQTTRTVQVSQRLENVALRQLEASSLQLRAAQAEAHAAVDAAREAQRARIDGFAPLVDLSVAFGTARYVPAGLVDVDAVDLAETTEGWPLVAHQAVESATFLATLRITLHNFGRTPAHVRFTHMDFSIGSEQTSVVLVEPGAGGLTTLEGRIGWRGSPRPNQPRLANICATVEGPIIGATRDTITWKGEITPLRDFGHEEGVRLNAPRPLKVVDYAVRRDYDTDQAHATI